MTRETRIGLLVGLLFIVMFGLVLSEFRGPRKPGAPQQASAAKNGTQGRPGPVIGDVSPLVARRPETGTPGAFPRDATRLANVAGGAAPGRIEVVVLPPADVARASEAAARRETVVGPTTMPAGGVVPPPPAPAGQKYVTQANDSLIRIAKRHYGENNWREYKRIFEANKGVLTSESVVPVGKELIIPPLPTVRVAEAPAAGAPPLARSPAPTAAPAAPAPAPRRASEMTIEEIARHFAASPQSTPVPATQPAPAAAKRTHVVQPGDNLAKIARQYFNSNSKSAVERIFNANRDKLSSPDFLPVGRELTIPS